MLRTRITAPARIESFSLLVRSMLILGTLNARMIKLYNKERIAAAMHKKTRGFTAKEAENSPKDK